MSDEKLNLGEAEDNLPRVTQSSKARDLIDSESQDCYLFSLQAHLGDSMG